MVNKNYIAGLFIALASLAFLIGYVSENKEKESLQKEGKSVRARIYDVTGPKGRGRMYFTSYCFYVGNEIYLNNYKTNVSERFRIGDSIIIVYLPSNPDCNAPTGASVFHSCQ